jgi:hypothetical protein
MKQQQPELFINPKITDLCVVSLPPVSVLSQTNTVRAIPSYLSKIHFNTILSYGPM